MNLHIVPDSKFSHVFYKNLQEIDLMKNNRVVVRTREKNLKYIKHEVPFAPLYSSLFKKIIGDTRDYSKVYIHQFSPLMYRWVAMNRFTELNWMTWGTDLYNLPFIPQNFYESMTRGYVKHADKNEWMYLLKLYLTNMMFKNAAYAKVRHVLTWMNTEFDFAKNALASLSASHQFFFYENEVPYHQLDSLSKVSSKRRNSPLSILVGNSGTPTNNHLDAVKKIAESGIEANLYIPLSYGDQSYINFVKQNLGFYKNGKIEFMEKFMAFNEYLEFLSNMDALVMNHIRPQGYGNIFMMMYLNKPVLMNSKNISLPDLVAGGLKWQPLENIHLLKGGINAENKTIVKNLLSHDRLLSTYRSLFS
jgi:dTDP-N-acetylfucosamine:lipid II N-acetylfucosaminyltransferase